MQPTAIMWFRRDLRVRDNPALSAAVRESARVVPLAVIPSNGSPVTMHVSHAWRLASLAALDTELRSRGARLHIREGGIPETLTECVREHDVGVVHCTRLWTPEGLAEEQDARNVLRSIGARLEVHEGSLLVTPPEARTASGTPYRVFTPFFRTWDHLWRAEAPSPAPERITGVDLASAGFDLNPSRAFLPPSHIPGELAALQRLDAFVADCLHDYDRDRDIPTADGTSRLSPYLAWGAIGPRQIAWAVTKAADEEDARPFIRQLAWREFAYHVLDAFPDLAERPLRPGFDRFPWTDDDALFAAWRDGQTGYPLVDAGMRQLACTGWMHNRVRLVAASFLVKDLLVSWQRGLRHFEESLTDHDEAANAFNWQWVAGSGADAAPYFRIFNPTTQARRFDPGTEYVHSWVPEYGTPEYPEPIVDHGEARKRALAAYDSIR